MKLNKWILKTNHIIAKYKESWKGIENKFERTIDHKVGSTVGLKWKRNY